MQLALRDGLAAEHLQCFGDVDQEQLRLRGDGHELGVLRVPLDRVQRILRI